LSLHDVALLKDSATIESSAEAEVGEEVLQEYYGSFWAQRVANDTLARRALEGYLTEIKRGEE
jgi:hypothetical protein